MTDLLIAQAVIEGDTVRAQSSNFEEVWSSRAIDLCRKYGFPSTEMPGLDAVFALPFDKKRVVIAQVAGQTAYRHLRLRLLVLGRELYHHLNDPFAIADQFPPDWEARGTLSELQWPPEGLPRRTISQLDEILKNGDGPFLLGACQTLVDSGKIALQRPAPEGKLIRDLWALLPESTRRATWPATYAFSDQLRFDLMVMPAIPEEGIPGYLGENQVRDYPDSRYERQLQVAVEAGDQRALDQLLARRSSAETLRLALSIVLLAVGVMLVVKALTMLNVI